MVPFTPSHLICAQIAAREQYAVPRALHQRELLHALFTDTWGHPTSLRARLLPGRRFQCRYHPQLREASVASPKLGSLAFELASRRPGFPSGWPRTMARNAWFQRWACRQLLRLYAHGSRAGKTTPLNVFSYSYAARSIFRLARQRGYHCVLGQMDPGPEEEQLVIAENRRYPHLAGSWQPAPAQYWQHWQEELQQTDRIVVNSPWSQRCLLRQGVPASKLRLIPLVYEPSVVGASAPPAAACWTPCACWKPSPCS